MTASANPQPSSADLDSARAVLLWLYQRRPVDDPLRLEIAHVRWGLYAELRPELRSADADVRPGRPRSPRPLPVRGGAS